MASIQRGLAVRRARRAAVTAQAWLNSRVAALRGDPAPIEALARARAICVRQGLRGPSDGGVPAEHEVLACAAILAERPSATPVPPAVLLAAAALLDQGAVELHRAADRHLALALAAVALSASGRPCHLIAASDEDAAAAATSMQPVLQACGVRLALLAMDTPAPQALAAYHADVVVATVRRLAGDQARERRYRQQNPLVDVQAPPALSARAALVDDLDRVLIDDASAPIVLSAADDATQLGAALATARELADGWPVGTSELDAQDQARLSELADRLPPFWRRADRREALLRQALFVRDRLRRGVDYDIGPTGQLMLDESLYERVPDRDFMVGLSQAVQARAGLPLSPVARTVERVSVQAFMGAYRRLGGVAPCLPGTAAELWRSHRLHVHPEPGEPRPPRPVWSVHADADGGRQALHGLCLQAGSATPRLMVLRRLADLAALQPLAAPDRVMLMMDGQGARTALRARAAHAPAVQADSSARLDLVFAEPLESRRAEQALALRVADLSGLPLGVTLRLLHPQARLFGDLPAWSMRLAGALVRRTPAAGVAWLRLTLAVARIRAHSAAVARRASVQQRELQLMQQLSFAAQAPRQPLVSAPPRTHETG